MSLLQIVKDHRNQADYWERYFYSKDWEQDAERWRLVKITLDRILEELGEDNE